MNKLHKEHQIFLKDFEKTSEHFKEINNNIRANTGKVSKEDKNAWMFWKEVLKKANKCIENGRDPEVSDLTCKLIKLFH